MWRRGGYEGQQQKQQEDHQSCKDRLWKAAISIPSRSCASDLKKNLLRDRSLLQSTSQDHDFISLSHSSVLILFCYLSCSNVSLAAKCVKMESVIRRVCTVRTSENSRCSDSLGDIVLPLEEMPLPAGAKHKSNAVRLSSRNDHRDAVCNASLPLASTIFVSLFLLRRPFTDLFSTLVFSFSFHSLTVLSILHFSVSQIWDSCSDCFCGTVDEIQLFLPISWFYSYHNSNEKFKIFCHSIE